MGTGLLSWHCPISERYMLQPPVFSGAVDIAELAREMHKEYTKTNNENVISDAKLIFGEYLSVEGSKNDFLPG